MSVFNREPFAAPARRFVLCAAAALALSGCAAFKPATPEEIVGRRAVERWQAIIKGDAATAYGYLSPAGRALISQDQWRGSFGAATSWQKVELDTVRCETSEKCIASVKVTHQPLLLRNKLGSIESNVQETWLSDGGQWWLLYRP